MIIVKEENTYVLKRSDRPDLEEVLNDLARDHGFSIFSFTEDGSGELEVNIHSTWIEDLEEIKDEDLEEIKDEGFDINLEILDELIDFALINTDVNLFYYK